MQSVKIHAAGVSVEITDDTRAPITIHRTQVFDKGSLDLSLRADASDFQAGMHSVSEAALAASGIILDEPRGLMWSQADVLTERGNQAAAEKACKELRLGGFDDWRLPTIQELLTLVDYTRSEPASDIAKFPACKSSWYWTSTPYASSPDCAWFVDFDDGDADLVRRENYDAFARAVRAVAPGQ